MTGPTAALATVVEKRSNSLICGSTSDGGRDIDARQPVADSLGGKLLMDRIAPGVQEADRHGLDIGVAQSVDRGMQ